MNHTSPLDGYRQEIEEAIRGGKSCRRVARLLEDAFGLETSERSIRRAVRRWEAENKEAWTEAKAKPEPPHFDKPLKPGYKVDGDTAEIITPVTQWTADLKNPEALMRERGLDPEDWEIDTLRVAEWGDPETGMNKQLRLNLKRKRRLQIFAPARVALNLHKYNHPEQGSPRMPWGNIEGSELVVFVGDHHAPHHDVELHKRLLDFLHSQRPDRGVLMGDGVDLPTISRHPKEPDFDVPVQECIDAFGQIIVDYKQASPETKWVKLPGNHLERLRRSVIDRLSEFYDLRPAQVEGLPEALPIYDPAYLLRLDELDIEYIRPKGKYDRALYQVSPTLAAIHGSVAKKGSGASAHAGLERIEYSYVQGHTHRQAIVQKAIRQINGDMMLLRAVETGAMCEIRDGLGYTVGNDWSNGFATAQIFDDNTFHPEIATFVDNSLYWRDLRF